ncbi:MAG: argininosuccinate lyase, partial [Edaphobacter sp.]
MPNEQQPAKMWSGRFREPLDPTFEAWQRSFPFDWRLIQSEIDASIAHARTIAAAGILTPDEEDRMVAGLKSVGNLKLDEGEFHNPASPAAASIAQAEDIH